MKTKVASLTDSERVGKEKFTHKLKSIFIKSILRYKEWQ